MMNDADARRQTPGLTTPMSAAHLYWCLGVQGSDVTQSAVQSFSIICHASWIMDIYVKILPPNRIGLLLEINGRLGLRIVANHGRDEVLLPSMSKYSPHLH
jgi:hypothetical protein